MGALPVDQAHLQLKLAQAKPKLWRIRLQRVAALHIQLSRCPAHARTSSRPNSKPSRLREAGKAKPAQTGLAGCPFLLVPRDAIEDQS